MIKDIQISQICQTMKLRYTGDDRKIGGLNLCNRKSVQACILSYVTDLSYYDTVKRNHAIAALVLTEECFLKYKELDYLSFIISDSPEKVFYDIHEYLLQNGYYEKYDFDSEIGNAQISDTAVIEKGVRIGNGVKIGANTVVRRGTVIEDNCIIGCNSTIGSEGFQVLRIDGKNRKIPHAGGVLIRNGAVIGDNTCICNSLFEGEVYVGAGAMIDNLVYIGHNLYIGENAVVTAHVILCGSAIIEDDAWIAPNASVLNRICVGKGAKVGLGAVVTKDVPPYITAYGNPAKIKEKR